jgi:hypothetical protein
MTKEKEIKKKKQISFFKYLNFFSHIQKIIKTAVKLSKELWIQSNQLGPPKLKRLQQTELFLLPKIFSKQNQKFSQDLMKQKTNRHCIINFFVPT